MRLIFAILVCFLVLLAGNASAQIKQSDREFEGLKGKVKSVLTERADASLKAGKVVESKRRKHEHMTYQANGSSSVFKHYQWDTGSLFETNTYIQIGGDKAAKIEMGPGAMTGTLTEAPPEGKPIKPWDPRYDYKYRYKYDERGRVAEMSMWQGDGDLWLRYIYEYAAANERRELVYDENGALNQKYAYILDAKGNEIEMVAYDPETGEIEGKEKYEYLRFDPHGNWTKRIEYEADSDGGFKFKLREVKYRTIVYYQ